MQRVRHLLDRPAERGQTLVLFALMSLTLMAGMGLVIDAGVNYSQRRNMQNAADTAALAGARIISRVNTFPGTTRQMVWNEVREAGVTNGVADNPALFQCEFVDTKSDPIGVSCNTAVDGGGGLPIPSYAAGVRVRVSETHSTFFMRAVGIATSSTSAASKAQIRAMTFMPTNDIVFAVCGVETMTRASTKDSILETEVVDDWTYIPVAPLYQTRPKTIATRGTTKIKDGAYKFDWNVRDALGNMTPDWDGSIAPTYQIFGSTIAQCDLPAQTPPWNGAIVQDSRLDIQMRPQGSTSRAPRVPMKGGAIGSNTLNHAINGTLGCKVGQLPTALSAITEPRLTHLATDGCVMILPIVDNGEEGWASVEPNERRGRVWGVFYVFNYGGYYYGWLIKNYPVHEDGEDSWNQQYTGPITIALTKVE